jgi:hypothetical protein
MCGFVVLLGIVGLFTAAGAHDSGMYIFGLALFVFATAFVFGQMKQGYDAADRATGRAHPRPEPTGH